MHSSCTWLRKARHGLRAACRQPLLGRETACWPWSARSCARSQAWGDDDLQLSGVCREVPLEGVAGYIRYLMPIANVHLCTPFWLVLSCCYHPCLHSGTLKACRWSMSTTSLCLVFSLQQGVRILPAYIHLHGSNKLWKCWNVLLAF